MERHEELRLAGIGTGEFRKGWHAANNDGHPVLDNTRFLAISDMQFMSLGASLTRRSAAGIVPKAYRPGWLTVQRDTLRKRHWPRCP